MRSLWLGPHLLNEPAGAAAHRAAQALGDTAHGEILATGDRLSQTSAVLAQQFYRNAAGAWSCLGAVGFASWVGLGEGLAGGDPIAREGANAFFSVPIERLGSEPLPRLQQWRDLAERSARVSTKLAAVFLQSTAPLMNADLSLAALTTWADAGVGLHGQHGWQGEFLAQAYFRAAPVAMRSLSPTAYRLWAGAGSALFPKVREREFFAELPPAMAGWLPEDQANLLRVTIALASLDHQAAYAVYRTMPASIASLPTSARSSLLRILAACGGKLGPSIRDFVPVAGAVLRQVPAHRLAGALVQVERLSARLPRAAASALRALPRVCEVADDERVAQWFATGIEVAAATPDATTAYFALESRTSIAVLERGSTAASLENSQGLLRKYIQMMAGAPAGIRAMDRFALRPDIEEFPDEREVALPPRVDVLPSHEENLRLYRLLAAHLAGRRHCDTYVAPAGTPLAAEDPPGRWLFRYLSDEERPAMMEDLFTLAEGLRVHCAMSREYRGLAGEAAWAAETLLSRWARQPGPTRTRRLDTLYLLALVDGASPHWPAWLDRGAAQTLLTVLHPLRSPAATVADSLRAAESLATELQRAGASVGADLGENDGSFYDTSAGEMIYYDLYDDADVVPAPQVDAPEAGAEQKPPRGDAIDVQLELGEEAGDEPGGAPMSAEELQRLLEMGADLRIRQGSGAADGGELGLYITDLVGKLPGEQIDELRRTLGNPDQRRTRQPRRWFDRRAQGICYHYDEWDYQIADYRSQWCQLYEIGLDGDAGEFFQTALGEHADLLPEVRRQFQRIRPEMYRTVRGLEDGEDFDLNAAVNSRIDARAGVAPSSRLYVARKREERDVAVLFLVDMSASTDEPLVDDPVVRRKGDRQPRRIIDVTKETLAIMAQALEEIGDAFAIYGFSGHGREQVEVYRVKTFAESLTPAVKARLGAIEPRRSTRMGTALRHAIDRFSTVTARSKHLILLSDGFPQDFDYGQDRRSNVYGIRDTAAALREAEAAGVIPFCITVDKAGHDYLREMCDESRYMVIDEISALPRELPKIYQRVVRG